MRNNMIWNITDTVFELKNKGLADADEFVESLADIYVIIEHKINGLDNRNKAFNFLSTLTALCMKLREEYKDK